MLLIGILRNAAKEGECERALNIIMAVDRGRDARHDALPDALVLAQGGDGANVLVRHARSLAALVLPAQHSGLKYLNDFVLTGRPCNLCSDPDTDWIRIQRGLWIRLRIRIQEGKNDN